MADDIQFPGIARFFAKEFERVTGSAKPGSVAALAKAVGVTPAAVSQWRTGQRRVTADHRAKMAKWFYPSSRDEQAAFIARLERADRRRRSAIDVLDAGEELRVGMVEYGKFGNHRRDVHYGLLGRLFQRFASFAALKSDAKDPFVRFSLEDPAERLQDQEVHMILGMLATVQRSRTMHFFQTPVRLTVNAVVLEQDLSRWELPRRPTATREAKLERLREILSPHRPEAPISEIRMVYHPTELGGLYAANQLGYEFRDQLTIVEAFDPQHYYRGLRGEPGERRLPIAIIDEYTCLELVLEAHKHSPRSAALIYELGDLATADTRPRFALGAAVNADDEKWITFLDAALRLFIDSDWRYIAYCFKELHEDITEIAERALAASAGVEADPKDTAVKWADGVVGLSGRKSGDSAEGQVGWSRILLRVIEILAKPTGNVDQTEGGAT
jgi:transcriptional regulator with XRE-family HTH domain